MQSLEKLRLTRNKITDVSPLINLINLGWLDVQQNFILDFSPLKKHINKKKYYKDQQKAPPKNTFLNVKEQIVNKSCMRIKDARQKNAQNKFLTVKTSVNFKLGEMINLLNKQTLLILKLIEQNI
ncbi:Leucine-rich_repeat domain superfamily [Hexamita inflata]|uniref:Leucine-rich repeat domain superfamily n=1 Tax=Hexamita inflata TaxID=28002 RepID=A0AA86QU67_9EUKA|nr:Leucine-rich repeat domain superfamily [Hexamita inflata]